MNVNRLKNACSHPNKTTFQLRLTDMSINLVEVRHSFDARASNSDGTNLHFSRKFKNAQIKLFPVNINWT